MPLHTCRLTPAILYFPLGWLMGLWVNIYSLERHSVCRATIKGLDTLRLRHVKGIAEERSIVIVVKCCYALCPIELTSHITGIIHHRIIL